MKLELAKAMVEQKECRKPLELQDTVQKSPDYLRAISREVRRARRSRKERDEARVLELVAAQHREELAREEALIRSEQRREALARAQKFREESLRLTRLRLMVSTVKHSIVATVVAPQPSQT